MLVFLLVLIVIAVLLELFSLRKPLSRVSYTVRTSRRSVDPAERFEVVSCVENHSRLPMPFLRIQEKLPFEMTVALRPGQHYDITTPSNISHGLMRASSSVYLMPRQKLTRSLEAEIGLRGRYFLCGADIHGGDFFGLSESFADFPCYCEIVVMPARAPETPQLTALGGFLGDVSVRRFIMEDPVLTMGFHDYTGREPQKSISWARSAREGKLIVREYDHTLEPSVTVVLNIDCEGAADAVLIEACYSLARSVCELLEAKRIKYGFITNASTAGAIGRWSFIGEGLGNSHLYTILEGLGRATYSPVEDMRRTASRAARMAEHGRSHIFITPKRTDAALEATALIRRETGGAITLIFAEESGVTK